MSFVHTHKNILTFYEVTYETGTFCRVIVEDYVCSPHGNLVQPLQSVFMQLSKLFEMGKNNRLFPILYMEGINFRKSHRGMCFPNILCKFCKKIARDVENGAFFRRYIEGVF